MVNFVSPSPLHPLNRYITTHDSSGKAAVSEDITSESQWTSAGEAKFFLGYCTSTFPVDLSSGGDVANYSSYLTAPPGLVVPGGTVLRVVDIPPALTSPMHRTTSLDYGVVLEGEIELILDSGETRLLKRGDICVQRATNHAWRNTSPTEWSRMLYVLVDSKPVQLDSGEVLAEELGGMEGVRKSG